MLRRARDIKGFRIRARDGEIGHVKEFYFDDESWTVRYLVAGTGTWLPGRKVLISPFAVRGFHVAKKELEVDLTRSQVEHSPPIAHDKPISRQFEEEYHRHYSFPFYWQGPEMWGPLPRPAFSYGQVTGPPQQTWPPAHQPSGDPHLQSTRAVTGYHIEARDGEIGHVEDFVIEDEDWVIQYVVVDTRNWWPGKRVLVSPAWAGSVDWHLSTVRLNLERQAIQRAPEYDPTKPITREYETRLFNHYDRKPYWGERVAA
jgi:hypothetical protein